MFDSSDSSDFFEELHQYDEFDPLFACDWFNSSDHTMMSHRETEKYTKGFILKCMNVIIESRLGESVVRKCSPTRNDWFNIAINDNEEVTQECLETLDTLHWIDPKSSDEKVSQGFTIDTQWRVVCEISLKTQDGNQTSLEYWMFENNPFNSQENTPPSASSPSNVSPSSPSGSPIMNSRNPNSFACVHQKMSLMIKSLMSLTRGTPSFKLSFTGPADDSYVIFYRILQGDPDFPPFLQAINGDDPEIHDKFSPEIRLGTISTNHNSIDIYYCQRRNLANYRFLQPTMAKAEDDTDLFKEDHFGGARKPESPDDRNSPCFVSKAREPRLAFGSISPVIPFPVLPPLPKNFPGISDDEDDDLNAPIDGTISSPKIHKRKFNKNDTPTKDQNSDPSCSQSASTEEKDRCESLEDEIKPPSVSQPIVIPSDRRNPNYHEPRHVDNSSPGSLESYVFIDHRPPFAPEHDDIQILFNGPQPSFVTNPTGSGELLSNIQETIAALETESENIDAFLESLNVKSGEDDEEDLMKSSSSNLAPF